MLHDFLQRLRHRRMLVKDALPVGVHAPVQGLVIEQLRGPFDRVDLGDLRRHDQPSDLEQFMRVTSL